MRTLFAAILIAGIQIAHAQPPEMLWEKYFNGLEGYGVLEAEDGGLILSNVWYVAQGNAQGCLIKTNADGDSLWGTFCGGDRIEFTYDVAQAADGGYAVAGHTYTWAPEGNDNGFVARFSQNGELVWQNNYGDWMPQELNCLVQTPDGGFAVAGGGGRLVGSFFYMDFYLLKIDGDGEEEWHRQYGYDGSEYCFALVQTNDGGFLLGGLIEDYVQGDTVATSDFWLVKTDSAGTEEWSRRYGGPEFEVCHTIIPADDGGFLLTGWTDSFGAGDRDFWALRVDEGGDSLWSRAYGGAGIEECLTAIATSDGGYALAGNSSTYAVGLADAWLVRINADDDMLWSANYGHEPWEHCFGLVETRDGGFVMSGVSDDMFNPEYGGPDIWLFKAGGELGTPQFPNPALPSALSLGRPYPNPFNSSVSLGFALNRGGMARVAIYDAAGRKIEELVEGYLEPGYHRIVWDAQFFPTGVYTCRLEQGGESRAVKLVLNR